MYLEEAFISGWPVGFMKNDGADHQTRSNSISRPHHIVQPYGFSPV